ncbi:hypothetical protein NUACC21_35260 [Scytonema sp. NUACC21]
MALIKSVTACQEPGKPRLYREKNERVLWNSKYGLTKLMQLGKEDVFTSAYSQSPTLHKLILKWGSLNGYSRLVGKFYVVGIVKAL